MKVGMFINYYIPSKGGMETSVINLCKGLVRAGHEPFVFAPKYPGYTDKEKNIFRYESFRFNYGGYYYVIPLPFMSHMEETVKKLNLDIIHSHQPYSLGDEAMKYARMLKIPLVFTYHIKYEDYSHYIPLLPSSIAKGLIRKITTGYSNKSDAVIAPSGAIKKLLLDGGVSSRIEIIPSGINIDEFAKGTGRREELRAKYKISPNDVALITACRITEEKNVKFLVEAFNKIKKTCVNAKFIIVGDGAVKKDLEAMVKDFGIENDVVFTGLVNKEEIISLYQASDIFVFASLTETQGLVAVEAMSAGIPAVAVRASGIEDMIISGEDGILTDNNVDEFSSSVIKVINDRDLRKRLSDQAKINSKKFTIELWTEKIVKLYDSLIKK
ncbi:MAG: glycosyltransferase [Candidatus Paceibacterota bacterium]